MTPSHGNVDHVVVIGGGAAGCAAAYYLSAAGARVTIVEREGVGTQASGWSAGGLNPLQGIPEPISALAMESYRLHLGLWPDLVRLTGRDFSARLISAAMIALDDSEIPPLLETQAIFEAAEGFSARWLDPSSFRAIEPRVTPDFAGALLTYGNGVVDSHLFTVALAEAAQQQGASLTVGTVSGVRRDGGRVTGVILADSVIACDAVVVAMGPWSQAADAWFDWPIPIAPLQGEILRMAQSGPPLTSDIIGVGVAIFGRAERQIWLGATQAQRGFDKEPTESARRTLLANGVRVMPSLAEATLLQQTVCLRPVTSDGLPIVGQVPQVEGAYFATGGGPKGVLLAPAMGKAVADLVLTGQTDLSVGACGLERFAPGSVT